MSTDTKLWIQAMGLSVLLGMAVALGTFVFVSKNITHLPGGSLSAGMMIGGLALYRYRLWRVSYRVSSGYLLVVLCALMGIVGWMTIVLMIG